MSGVAWLQSLAQNHAEAFRSKIFVMALSMRALIIAVSLLHPAFAQTPSGLKTVIDKTCWGCHSGAAAKGGLDFASLSFDLSNRVTRERWVRVHDRVEKGEMPPRGVELAAA